MSLPIAHDPRRDAEMLGGQTMPSADTSEERGGIIDSARSQGSFVRRGPSRFVRETLELGREALQSEQALKITPGGRQKRATSEAYFPFQQSPGWGMEG